MIEKIEFKYKAQKDIEEWDKLLVVETLNIDTESPVFNQVIDITISSIFINRGPGEVRWNFKNSYQGHYKNVSLEMS